VFLVARATAALMHMPEITERQRRLAEITEMIHTASLVHDDVLDDCDTRRGQSTIHSLYGTRVAILAGDFLFAQSSWYLANLDNLVGPVRVVCHAIKRVLNPGFISNTVPNPPSRIIDGVHAPPISEPGFSTALQPENPCVSCGRRHPSTWRAIYAWPYNLEVIKLISQVIADFADGEISQAGALFDCDITLEQYLEKSHNKTASLIAASCKSAAVFSECSEAGPHTRSLTACSR